MLDVAKSGSVHALPLPWRGGGGGLRGQDQSLSTEVFLGLQIVARECDGRASAAGRAPALVSAAPSPKAARLFCTRLLLGEPGSLLALWEDAALASS